MKTQSEKKAQVFILLGQSNAVGHALPMKEEDKIVQPLKNVFGLHRQFNQSYDIEKLTWSGYTSAGMNLAEEDDDTYSVANCLAANWQRRIDNGEDLPELYIVQIAIGAQGVTQGYMWNPDKEKLLKPGRLGVVDISLYSFTCHILSMIEKSFAEKGQEYEILGLHWRGGEEETVVSMEILENTLQDIYHRIFSGFKNSLNREAPIVLHKLVIEECMNKNDPTGERLKRMNYINGVFETLGNEWAAVKIFDPRNYPNYDGSVENNQLFKADLVHFLAEVNEWVSEEVVKDYKAKK